MASKQGGPSKRRATASSSSSSTNGRGPVLRIDHREEAKRPVVRIAGYRTFDAGGEENAILPKIISQIVRTFYPGPYLTFKSYPESVKETCWKDFQLYYKFAFKTNMEKAEKVFGRIADKRLQDMLWKAKDAARKIYKTPNIHDWRMRGPPSTYSWIQKNHWKGLCDHWCSDGFAAKSKTNSANRLASGESTFSTTGSVNMLVHKHRFEIERKRPPHKPELFDKCHTKKGSDEYITQKAKETREDYDRRIIEEYGDDPSNHPAFDEKIWDEIIGKDQHGRRYGEGSISKSSSDDSDMTNGATEIDDLENRLVDRVTKKVSEQLGKDLEDRIVDRVSQQVSQQLIELILRKNEKRGDRKNDSSYDSSI